MVVRSDISRANKEKPSLATTVLASSATFAVFTAFLYFVAGAYYQGRTSVSGTGYLTMPPPNDFVYSGAKLMLGAGMLVVLICSIFWFAFSMVCYLEVRFPQWFTTASDKILRLSRVWELVVSGAVTIGAVWFLLTTVKLLNEPARVVTDHVCTPTGQLPQHHPGVFLLLTILFTATVPNRFGSRRSKWTGWLIGSFVALCLMYGFAWDAGRESLLSHSYSQAKVKLNDSSNPEYDALIIGSDDKDLVIITHAKTGQYEPEYLSRSRVVDFRLIGSATVEQFMCGIQQHSPPR